MGGSVAILPDPAGGVRLRCARSGHDPRNLSLDRRLLTFDSAWRNALRIRESKVVSGGSLVTGTVGISGGTATRTHKVIPISGSGPDRPTLAWQRNNGGSLLRTTDASAGSAQISQGYGRGYGVCGVSQYDSFIAVSPARDGVDYVYYVLGTNPTVEEAAVAGGGLVGNHELYGPGIYIVRRGLDPRTASLDDMILTSHRNHLQVVETAQRGDGTHDTWVQNDPFPFTALSNAHARVGYFIDLVGSYPNYPPVIAYPLAYSNTGSGDNIRNSHSCSIFWINPSRLLVASSMPGGVRIGVLARNEAYDWTAPAPIVPRRIGFIGGDGLGITKKGINFDVAGPDDFLFRCDRQSAHFTGIASIPTGASTGIYALPNPPAAGGVPFSIFSVFWNAETGWWCGCGMVTTQDCYRASPIGSNYYFGPAFVAMNGSLNTYRWFNDVTFSSGWIGCVATMNVSDF